MIDRVGRISGNASQGTGGVRWLVLLLSVAVCEAAGGIGSIFTFGAIGSWYEGLNKSPLNPPNWLFAPMWVTLYFLMGVALYFVFIRRGLVHDSWIALTLFFIQLSLNVLWSALFFGLHQLLFGAVEIVFLWFFIAATTIEFRTVDKKASYLLFPYLAWVTVATVLNFSILWVNP